MRRNATPRPKHQHSTQHNTRHHTTTQQNNAPERPDDAPDGPQPRVRPLPSGRDVPLAGRLEAALEPGEACEAVELGQLLHRLRERWVVRLGGSGVVRFRGGAGRGKGGGGTVADGAAFCCEKTRGRDATPPTARAGTPQGQQQRSHWGGECGATVQSNRIVARASLERCPSPQTTTTLSSSAKAASTCSENFLRIGRADTHADTGRIWARVISWRRCRKEQKHEGKRH